MRGFRVNYGYRLSPEKAQSDEPWFRISNAIVLKRYRDSAENQSRITKIHAVLAQIGAALGLVPG